MSQAPSLTTSTTDVPDVNRPPGKVVVGLSGGVDSAVVAAVLKTRGFDVVGMTMQIWHRSQPFGDNGPGAGCCTIDAIDDARRVARQLAIPYYVPNFREPFSQVVDDFAREYASGRTPNPCVRCNQFVRFDGLMEKADEVGATYVATGHYARVEYDPRRAEHVLLRATDPRKDQSYVLHTLKQHHLRRLIFPLGSMEKSRTRALAQEYGLGVASKPDSQEICFVAGGDYREFLRSSGAVQPQGGPIVNLEGEVVGQHEGVHLFTVGQRKGLGLPGSSPYFVVALRPEQNTVVVGRRADLGTRDLECEDVELVGRLDAQEFGANVRVRSHAPEIPAVVRITGRSARVRFDETVLGAAPGQLAVFYVGDRVVGGATIVSTGTR